MKISKSMGLVIVVGLVAAFILFGTLLNDIDTSTTLQRQLQGQLSDQERELQKANTSLGLAQSKLVSAEELNKQLGKQSKEFKAFRKKHSLIIKSRDKTIASLSQKITEGTTTVIDRDDVIEYMWQDIHERFKLIDTDIFTPDNEIFTAKQIFMVSGEIYKERNGELKTRKLLIKEVYIEGNRHIDLGEADIISSHFTYTPDVKAESWLDAFKLRLRLSADSALGLGFGAELLEIRHIGIGASVRVPLLKMNEAAVGLDLYIDVF